MSLRLLAVPAALVAAATAGAALACSCIGYLTLRHSWPKPG